MNKDLMVADFMKSFINNNTDINDTTNNLLIT